MLVNCFQVYTKSNVLILAGVIDLQSEEIKRDPEMDKSAVWAGSGCMAVFPISGSRLISPPGTCT